MGSIAIAQLRGGELLLIPILPVKLTTHIAQLTKLN